MRKCKRILWSLLKQIVLPAVKFLVLQPFFFSQNSKVRYFVFKLLWATGYDSLLYVHIREKYLVNSRDLWLGGHVYAEGVQDFEKFELAISILRKNGLFENGIDLLVDAGANIGTICIPALCRGLVKRAVAIEANPNVSRLLKSNVILNDLDSMVQVVEKALSEKDGESLVLQLSKDNHGDNRIRPSGASEAIGMEVKVQTISLDSLLKQREENLLIWMDLQGYEGIALLGASRLLSGSPPMVVEFWPGGMKKCQSFEALKKAAKNYEKFVDLKNPTVSCRIDELDKLYVSLGEGEDFTDILLM